MLFVNIVPSEIFYGLFGWFKPLIDYAIHQKLSQELIKLELLADRR